MNTDKILAESIAKEYAPKDSSKILALKKLDKKEHVNYSIWFMPMSSLTAGHRQL